ncbi:hypothetical protein ACWGID_28295 [Kribbella sp. NPDC054772]
MKRRNSRRVRHPDVYQDDVRPMQADLVDGLAPVLRLADGLDVVGRCILPTLKRRRTR